VKCDGANSTIADVAESVDNSDLARLDAVTGKPGVGE
jgi:hypothetical protein